MYKKRVNKEAVDLCCEYIRNSSDYTFQKYLESQDLWRDVDTSGRHPKLSCPFHSDSTPSLYIDEERKLFKCFSCEKGGGYLKFLVYMSQLVLHSNKGFYQIVNQILSEDYIMRLRVGLTTIYELDKSVTDFANHKRRKFVYNPNLGILTLPELYHRMVKENLVSVPMTRLAILYDQEGFSPQQIYTLLKGEETSVNSESMFEGMSITDLMSDIDFEFEEAI
jgi:hypothetical protein